MNDRQVCEKSGCSNPVYNCHAAFELTNMFICDHCRVAMDRENAAGSERDAYSYAQAECTCRAFSGKSQGLRDLHVIERKAMRAAQAALVAWLAKPLVSAEKKV